MKLTHFLAIGLVAMATMAAAQDVKTDYDHHANFSQYHTYYWEKVKTYSGGELQGGRVGSGFLRCP